MPHKIGGLDIRLPGAPEQRVSPDRPVRSVALFGGDYPDMRTEIVVAPGDTVAAGDPVFCDRKRPAIRIVAPNAGRVTRIERGAKRRLSILEIEGDGDAAREFEPPDLADRAAVADALCTAGLWTAFRARPFGRVPDPEIAPEAIFLTAMATEPLAADAAVVIGAAHDAFALGLSALAALTDGPVFVCQGPGGPDLAAPSDRVRVERFAGSHPAGLAGTHIDRLRPGSAVWQVDYQDVIAIGRLLADGRVDGYRVIALTGPGLAAPRLVRAPDGASLPDMLAGELTPGPKTVLSGSPLAGRDSSHLRRRHWQVTVFDRAELGRPSVNALRADARTAPLIPSAALDRALGPRIPVVPLLRALACGDHEAAARLGAIDLLEEDLALASYAAGNGDDYGALLRRTLDALETAA